MDEPFIRALSRLDEEEWSNADILLVTDGEIRPPVRRRELELLSVVTHPPTRRLLKGVCFPVALEDVECIFIIGFRDFCNSFDP